MVKRIVLSVWRNLAVVALLLASAIGVYLYVGQRNLIANNSDRISDIQQSRIDGCRRNYEAFTQVFRIFFNDPENQGPRERANIRRFNVRVVQLERANCNFDQLGGKP